MADIALSNGFRPSPGARRPVLTLPTQSPRPAPGTPMTSDHTPLRNGFTASGLPSRARELMVLLDSIGRATKVIEAADRGLKGLTQLIEAAQGSTRQALHSPSTTPKVTGANALALSSATMLHTASAGAFVPGDTITVNGTEILTVQTGDGVDDVIGSINSDAILNPPNAPRKVQAALNARGQIVVEALNGAALAISGSAPAKVSTLFGRAPLSAAENINPIRKAFAAEFDALRSQMDRLAADSGYNGTNLLAGGRIKVQFDDRDTASLSVNGVTFDAAGLSIAAATNGWQSDRDIRDAISSLDAGLMTLGNQSASLASNLSVVQTRQDFTAGLADRLEPDAERLLPADESEEAARLIMLHTRQQLGATALSLATQSEQSVLRLF